MSTHDKTGASTVRLDGAAPAPAGDLSAPAGPAPTPAGRGSRDTGERTRRRWPRLVAALTVIALAGAGAAWWWRGGAAPAGGDAKASGVATTTAPVVKRTLSSMEEVDGTLGFSGADTVAFGRRGTVTWLPEEGAIVKRGGTMFKVDDKPVPLLYGTLPAYRDLRTGVDDGRDVKQLESNLKALGYDPGTVDDHFSSDTREALEDWQEDLGAEETGRFMRGDAALAPGPVRVAELSGTVGGPAGPGAAAMKVTTTTRQVDVDLPANKQALVRAGDAVTITLPDGGTTKGKVSDVSRVAKAPPSSGQGGNGDDDPTVAVTVTLNDPKAAGALDQAPVDVAITTETSKDALAVPIDALLALAEGGYAVEVQDAAGRHLVPVELGLFADDLVEVTVKAGGQALREGMRVVVPV